MILITIGLVAFTLLAIFFLVQAVGIAYVSIGFMGSIEPLSIIFFGLFAVCSWAIYTIWPFEITLKVVS
jgi:uncharacterized protein with PQ loop repeat